VMFGVLVMKQTLDSVNMQDGEDTAAITLRTLHYRVFIITAHITAVSNCPVLFLVFYVESCNAALFVVS